MPGPVLETDSRPPATLWVSNTRVASPVLMEPTRQWSTPPTLTSSASRYKLSGPSTKSEILQTKLT